MARQQMRIHVITNPYDFLFRGTQKVNFEQCSGQNIERIMRTGAFKLKRKNRSSSL